MTPEERAKKLFDEWKQTGEVGGSWLYMQFVKHIKEAMRDQRHACADALSEILSTGDKTVIMSQAHQAVFNAEVKPKTQP